ncbi:ATP/GTP-binding protein [Actinomadura sp. WAC 06369]|uniref:ATP/GTP-binding protein n=1 Tax=Actinomadura sp. WAC 06369 TaxID=2203193 RepID=UPI000F79EF3E|nr:ATP/GTP-binding protein [Actinomadura sp. WAC 06369]RSN67269.1 ATP/GTP-binding protein [Actinomadura sp. WAC 06369]
MEEAALSRPDLRALFRTNTRALVATDVFANRADEWAALQRSLVRVVETRRDRAFDVEDVQRPRRNVLVFYGVGGVGKSTLSRQIGEVLTDSGAGPEHWPPVDGQLGRLIPVRIDLARQNGVSFESVVLAVRVALTELGRPLTAFDLAFLRYWEHHHPGDPLDEFLRRHTMLNRFGGAGRLRSQMDAAMGDVASAAGLPGTAGMLVGQGLASTVRALRERRRAARAVSGCRRLPDLLEAEPDQDALSFYPHLLAWDLAQLPEEKTATPVVLLDTFEDVGDRVHRDVERLIQRMVWLMPNALFVVTGRNRLQWDDARLEGQLDWVGPTAWPQLVPGAGDDPRQHRVGYLSQTDCEDYLRRRLLIEEQPLMDAPTRRVLISHSKGLPLYLDMAVMRFLDLYERAGQAPDMSEFDLEFPALVARTFRDLSAEERTVLRAVSLLDSFSVELATAAAGLDYDAAALRLADRPFVDVTPGAQWPYRLHDLVRTAIRDTDTTGDDRWTPQDRRRAAERAFDAIGNEFTRHRGDRRVLLGCLRQGLRLAREHDLPLGWLGDAALDYVRDFVWEPVEDGTGDIDSPAAALGETLTAVARRQRQHRGRTADRLRAVLSAGLLPPELDELPRYFLAECERDLGNLTASMDGMRRVSAGGGALAPDAARGLLHLERRLGHFTGALARAEELPPGGKKHRTIGEILWTQADVTSACAALTRAREDALAAGQHGEAALCQAYLAFTSAFQDRGRSLEQIARAERMLDGVNVGFADLQVRNARLLLAAGRADDMAERVDDVAALAAANGVSSCAAYARLALCFHAAARESPELMSSARRRLDESVRGEEFAYLMEITYFLTGEDVPDGLPRAHWIGGEARVRAQWSGLVAERRRDIGGEG